FKLSRNAIGNITAIDSIINLLLETRETIYSEYKSIISLKNIVYKQQIYYVFYRLKNYLDKENAFSFFNEYSQNMSYLTFYNTWHYYQHFITDDQAIINSNIYSSINKIKLVNLNDILNKHIIQNLELNKVKLICFDSNNFVNQEQDDPALKIYTLMQEEGYPEWTYGIPKNMSELFNFWRINLANWESEPVLIFQETLQKKQSMGFSDTLLEHLNSFGGAICVISDRPRQNNLQYFSPTQPQLVENILGWIRRTVLEQ
ncbi:MAG: hypothetical protein AAGE84_32140, partial [Cyanobacteria bacterium P01_G01_bin.39]